MHSLLRAIALGSFVLLMTIANAHAYQFSMDTFTLKINGFPVLVDTFSDGLPPPNGPLGAATWLMSGSAGPENVGGNGRLLLTDAGGVFSTGLLGTSPNIAQTGRLNTSITNTNPGAGPNRSTAFSITARFDMAAPQPGELAGIRVEDRVPGVNDGMGNDIIDLRMGNIDGTPIILFRKTDQFAATQVTFSVPLQLGHDQIDLTLDHPTANTDTIFGRYEYVDAGVGKGVHTFAQTFDIFHGELFTRATFAGSVISAAADTQPPTVPAGLTAQAVSGVQINLSSAAAADNVRVTQYKIYRGGILVTTVNDLASRGYSDIGLTPGTLYAYTVQACDAAANCSAQSDPASATTLPTGQIAFSPKLEIEFNLGSNNTLNSTLNVAALFGNQDAPVGGVTSNIVSVWKWNAVTGRWAFYSPQLTASGNADHAASNHFDLLATVNPGEGFWMNASNAITLPAQNGTGFAWNGFTFSALPSGYNLIAQANAMTPSQFNQLVSQTPPSPGVIPTDTFVSLWAWDMALGKWYFYSPQLEASGGLAAVKSYADSHGYLHFEDYSKTLGVGEGFWVNR